MNISLDSALPVVKNRNQGEDEILNLFLWMRSEWRTVELSIDFVDFVVAKNFSNVVDEWFSGLAPTPQSGSSKFLTKYNRVLLNFLNQIPRIGMAVFIITYVNVAGGLGETSVEGLAYASGIGLIIWSMLSIVDSSVTKFVSKRIYNNLIPSVILITEKDNKVYEEIKLSCSDPRGTIAISLMTFASGIAVNMISSYIYAKFF